MTRPMFLSWIHFIRKPPASQISPPAGACDKDSKVPKNCMKGVESPLQGDSYTLLSPSKECHDESFSAWLMSEPLRISPEPDRDLTLGMGMGHCAGIGHFQCLRTQ